MLIASTMPLNAAGELGLSAFANLLNGIAGIALNALVRFPNCEYGNVLNEEIIVLSVDGGSDTITLSNAASGPGRIVLMDNITALMLVADKAAIAFKKLLSDDGDVP